MYSLNKKALLSDHRNESRAIGESMLMLRARILPA